MYLYTYPRMEVLWYSSLQGIGDSGQGFLNAILFILSTQNVRLRLFALFRCKNCRMKSVDDKSLPSKHSHESYKHIQDHKHHQKTIKTYMSKPPISSCSESSPIYANRSFGSKRYYDSIKTNDVAHPLVNTSASYSATDCSS